MKKLLTLILLSFNLIPFLAKQARYDYNFFDNIRMQRSYYDKVNYTYTSPSLIGTIQNKLSALYQSFFIPIKSLLIKYISGSNVNWYVRIHATPNQYLDIQKINNKVFVC